MWICNQVELLPTGKNDKRFRQLKPTRKTTTASNKKPEIIEVFLIFEIIEQYIKNKAIEKTTTVETPIILRLAKFIIF